MATIEERRTSDGKIRYRVKIRMKGAPTEVATFRRKTDARNWAQETEAAIRNGRYFKTSEAKRHTVAEMIDRYSRDVLPRKKSNTQYSQAKQLAWWKREIGKHTLAEVTPAVIAEKRDLLLNGKTKRGDGRSPSTVLRYLAPLSHCFNIAMKEWGWVDDNPMRKVTKPSEGRGRVRFLSNEERAALLEACKESRNAALYDIVVLAISTGMRRSEIMNLTWDRIDCERGTILLEDTKNNERRAVPLTGHARDVISERQRLRRIDTNLVFPAPMKRGTAPKPIDIQSAWDWAVARAKLENFRFHDLRHTAASYLAMNGATLAEIADILGHKTLAMVKRYAHLSEAHTSRVVEAMNSAIFAPNGPESEVTHEGE